MIDAFAFLAALAVLLLKDAVVVQVGLITSAFDSLKTAGSDMMQGLIDGIDSMLDPLRTAMATVSGIVQTALPDALQMHSPSRLMFEQGVDTATGYIGGIAANETAIQGATANMGHAAIEGAAIQGATAGIGQAAIGGATAYAPANFGAAGSAIPAMELTQNIYQLPGESQEGFAARAASEAEKALRRMLEDYEAA